MVDDSEKFGKQLQAQTDAGRNTMFMYRGKSISAILFELPFPPG